MHDALEKVLPLSSGARACGRALGLKRSLGWQVYALANASDAATTLRALPRAQGWDLILQASARSGCPARELDALRTEAKALESFLRLSRIDRDLLRAAACGGLDSARETSAMLRARRAATIANERIFGLAAHTTMTAVILTPVDTRGRFDSISATFLHGIKRSRAGSPWPIYLSAETMEKRGQEPKVGKRSRTAGSSSRCVHRHLTRPASTTAPSPTRPSLRQVRSRFSASLVSPAAAAAAKSHSRRVR